MAITIFERAFKQRTPIVAGVQCVSAAMVSGAAELHQVKNLARQSFHLASHRARRTEKEKARRSRAF
jgi:hypothetical protein